MQADVSEPVSAAAANELAMHLRRNPGDATRDAGELAAEFTLPRQFVESVLVGIQSGELIGERRHEGPGLGRRLGASVRHFLDLVMGRPMVFVLTTLGIAIGAEYLISTRLAPTRANQAAMLQWAGALLAIQFLVFALHMVCYYRHRMGRYALYGGLAVWISLTALALIGGPSTGPQELHLSGLGGLFVVVSVMFILGLLYAGCGVMASVIGGFVHVRRRRRQEEEMSRQDMLERYFELQGRLQSGPSGETGIDSIFEARPVRFFRRNYIVLTFVAGTIINSLLLTLQVVANIRVGSFPQMSMLVVVVALLQALVVFCHIVIGFFAKSVPWAMIGSLLYSAGLVPPVVIATSAYHVTSLESPILRATWVLRSVVLLVVAITAALGATVQRRAERDKSLQQNEPAAILSEMVRLQWRLGDRATEVVVLVVDAAKSSEMKSAADPLAIEYSFREYLEWIAAISEGCGGKVHSTAGDGAIVSFSNAQEALLAARRLQTDVVRFNREDNRLESPFRLRIGLHLGSVAGDLDEVQFAEVIDIAAHVQDVSPISGIIVTAEVAARLPDDTFIPLANPVDGHQVLLALNPVTDE